MSAWDETSGRALLTAIGSTTCAMSLSSVKARARRMESTPYPEPMVPVKMVKVRLLRL